MNWLIFWNNGKNGFYVYLIPAAALTTQQKTDLMTAHGLYLNSEMLGLKPEQALYRIDAWIDDKVEYLIYEDDLDVVHEPIVVEKGTKVIICGSIPQD